MKTGDNPEDGLIDVLAAQIQDDEKLIDALGAGLLAVEDLEAWFERRKRSEVRFFQICGPLIEKMRVQGFERAMNRVPVRHAGQKDHAPWNG
jgi:hypothetical protein